MHITLCEIFSGFIRPPAPRIADSHEVCALFAVPRARPIWGRAQSAGSLAARDRSFIHVWTLPGYCWVWSAGRSRSSSLLLLMRMAGQQDRAARHEQKRLDPFADVTITKIGEPPKTGGSTAGIVGLRRQTSASAARRIADRAPCRARGRFVHRRVCDPGCTAPAAPAIRRRAGRIDFRARPQLLAGRARRRRWRFSSTARSTSAPCARRSRKRATRSSSWAGTSTAGCASRPAGANDGLPEPLGDFLNAIVAARRGLRGYVLSWDFAMLYTLEREWLPIFKLDWRTHRRLSFRLDDQHSRRRVASPEDRRRRRRGRIRQRLRSDDECAGIPAGTRRTTRAASITAGIAYPPFHDVGIAVGGDCARALGELARERWRRATRQIAATRGRRRRHPMHGRRASSPR